MSQVRLLCAFNLKVRFPGRARADDKFLRGELVDVSINHHDDTNYAGMPALHRLDGSAAPKMERVSVPGVALDALGLGYQVFDCARMVFTGEQLDGFAAQWADLTTKSDARIHVRGAD